MAFIITNKKQYLTRLPFHIFIIVFITFSPLIIGGIGAWITELNGDSCNEGNCIWMVLPWLTLFKMPIGGIAFLVYTILVALDTIKLLIKRN